MAGGRPSKWKDEFVEQAKKLAVLGATDEQIAWFFDVSLADVAYWALNNRAFFDAITPSLAEIEENQRRIAARRQRINAKKRDVMANSLSARIRNAVSARLWAALKGRSDGALFSRLGYSADELVLHLEERFSEGMTWENYGKWHVDHKKPCALFDQSNPAEFAECWALKNIQPLWATDNVRKGAKYAGA